MKLKLMVLLMLVSLISASTMFLPSASAQKNTNAKSQTSAKTPKLESDKAQQAAAGETDTNVKNDMAPNSKSGPAASAPPAKGGEKGKGLGPGYAEVTFNNFSPWYVKCYVDGNYRGTIAPWGALNFPTGNGPTSLYARADFDDGSSYRWGPRQVLYYSGYRYEWRLGL